MMLTHNAICGGQMHSKFQISFKKTYFIQNVGPVIAAFYFGRKVKGILDKMLPVSKRMMQILILKALSIFSDSCFLFICLFFQRLGPQF